MRYLIAIVVALGLLGGSYWLGYRQREVVTIEKEKRVEVTGETKTIWKDRIVVVEKIIQPDGTVKETTTTTEKTKEQEKKSDKVSEEKQDKPVLPPLSRYSLALHYRPRLEVLTAGKPAWQDFSSTAGIRILDLPVWGEVGLQPAIGSHGAITLGLRVEL